MVCCGLCMMLRIGMVFHGHSGQQTSIKCSGGASIKIWGGRVKGSKTIFQGAKM